MMPIIPIHVMIQRMTIYHQKCQEVGCQIPRTETVCIRTHTVSYYNIIQDLLCLTHPCLSIAVCGEEKEKSRELHC